MCNCVQPTSASVEIEVIPWLTDFLAGHANWIQVVRPRESVRALLGRLRESHPQLAAAVYSQEEEKLTGLVNIVLNDCALELAGGLDRVLRDGDRLILIPAYAGG